MISGTEAANLWVSLATQEGRLDCCPQAVFRLFFNKIWAHLKENLC